MSKFSSAPVNDDEYLARFVFSPIHLSKKGEIKPSLFSHVSTIGCSIQRETIASSDEIGSFISKFLSKDTKYSWNSVLIAKTEILRKVLIESTNARALCLYDTAEEDNPSHGEMHQMGSINEADQIELRHDILQAFVSAKKLTPNSYRNGDVLGIVPEQFKSQIA